MVIFVVFWSRLWTFFSSSWGLASSYDFMLAFQPPLQGDFLGFDEASNFDCWKHNIWVKPAFALLRKQVTLWQDFIIPKSLSLCLSLSCSLFSLSLNLSLYLYICISLLLYLYLLYSLLSIFFLHKYLSIQSSHVSSKRNDL